MNLPGHTGHTGHKMLKNDTRALKFLSAIYKSCNAYSSKAHPRSSKFEAFMPWFNQKDLMRGSLQNVKYACLMIQEQLKLLQ